MLASSQTNSNLSHPSTSPDRSNSLSSPESTPDYSASGFLMELPPVLTSPVFHDFNLPAEYPSSSSDLSGASQPQISIPSTQIPPHLSSFHDTTPVKLEPTTTDSHLFSIPSHSSPDIPIPTLPTNQAFTPNRICSISLWTDGIVPYVIDIDKLISLPSSMQSISWYAPSRLLLRVKIGLPMNSQLLDSPAQQGVHGAVTFAAPWNTVAHCHTKLWSGMTCIAKEPSAFKQFGIQHENISQGIWPSSTVVAYLPDSALSRCKFLQTSTCILPPGRSFSLSSHCVHASC